MKLPAQDIASVKATKRMLMKQAVITMEDGQEFSFDYGFLSVKKLVATIQSIIKD